MGNSEYDVIVIGAGPGGATCSALLAKNGLRTLLIEKNDRPGGKAMTISNRGFKYELWPVTGGPLYDSRFETVLKELGKEPEIMAEESFLTLYYRDNDSGEYKRLRLPRFKEAPDMPKTFSWLGIDPMLSEGAARLFADLVMLSDEDVDKLDEISFHEFIADYDIPGPLYSMLAAQLNVVFVLPIDQVAASEGVKTLKEMFTGGAGVYFKGGYGRYSEKCVDALIDNGGDVLYNLKVKKIDVIDGKVTGVVTEKGTFNAPIIVSNAGIQPTVIKLVGEDQFTREYTDYVKGLVPSLGLMGIRYFLNKRVLDCPFHIAFSDEGYFNEKRYLEVKSGSIPDEMVVFMTVPSEFDASLSPPGKQCVLSSTLCPPDPELEDKESWWKRIDEMVGKIWPELPAHIESKELYGTNHVSSATRDHVLPGKGGECIGLGQVIGQCGKHKPSAGSPIQGLFYVGCDAGGYGCGTHQGADSGYNVAQMVSQYFHGV